MSTTAGIVKTPDAIHGNLRLNGTRVGVFQVGELVRQQGWTREAVAEQFDLDEQQVEAALTYYDDDRN